MLYAESDTFGGMEPIDADGYDYHWAPDADGQRRAGAKHIRMCSLSRLANQWLLRQASNNPNNLITIKGKGKMVRRRWAIAQEITWT